jgi:hypothetical protein
LLCLFQHSSFFVSVHSIWSTHNKTEPLTLIYLLTGLIKTLIQCTYYIAFQVPGPSRGHTSFQDDHIQDNSNAQDAEDIAEEDAVPGTPPPPLSKKARYIFKRCFEATFNSQMIPGYDEVLAEDSDDESNKRT